MKTLTRIGIFSFLLFICVSAKPFKQTASVHQSSTTASSVAFDFFRTHRQGKGITSVWGLSSDAGVAGFVVKKTYEDPADPSSFWEDVNNVQCNSSRSYKYTDNNVSPGFVSYCIVAVMNDGSAVVSDYSTEHIVRH
ncbi:MAG: hypothetical protein JJE22_09690 [Bacteroidia bacterium]|nr:hypothetical protein [Bacteroidia bacterium]